MYWWTYMQECVCIRLYRDMPLCTKSMETVFIETAFDSKNQVNLDLFVFLTFVKSLTKKHWLESNADYFGGIEIDSEEWIKRFHHFFNEVSLLFVHNGMWTKCTYPASNDQFCCSRADTTATAAAAAFPSERLFQYFSSVYVRWFCLKISAFGTAVEAYISLSTRMYI